MRSGRIRDKLRCLVVVTGLVGALREVGVAAHADLLEACLAARGDRPIELGGLLMTGPIAAGNFPWGPKAPAAVGPWIVYDPRPRKTRALVLVAACSASKIGFQGPSVFHFAYGFEP